MKLLLRIAKETKGERIPLFFAMLSTLALTGLGLAVPRIQMLFLQ